MFDTEKGLIVYIDVEKIDVWMKENEFGNNRLKELLSCKGSFMSIYLSGSTGVTRQRVSILIREFESFNYPISNIGVLIPDHNQLITKNIGYVFVPRLLNSTVTYYKTEYADIVQDLQFDEEVNKIPMAYLLIEPAQNTTVGKVTKSNVININDKDVLYTYLVEINKKNLPLLFLDAGSGAEYPITAEFIKSVRKNYSGKLMVGGGLTSMADIQQCLQAGANYIVIGKLFEDCRNIAETVCRIRDLFI